MMAFSNEERVALLALHGVGPTVVSRFELLGIDSFERLATFEAREIAEQVASMLNTSCWKNSPRALAAVEAAIVRARQGLQE